MTYFGVTMPLFLPNFQNCNEDESFAKQRTINGKFIMCKVKPKGENIFKIRGLG